MIALLDITTLTLATLFALAAATALHWLLLHVAFRMMQPAAARRVLVSRHRSSWPGTAGVDMALQQAPEPQPATKPAGNRRRRSAADQRGGVVTYV